MTNQPKRDPWTGLPAEPWAFTTTSPAEIHSQGRREYGEAHETTGRWIQENLHRLAGLGSMVFDVIMIKHKLDRLLNDPSRPDHLDDLIGYANLAKGLQAQGDWEPTIDLDFEPHTRPATALDYIQTCFRMGVQPSDEVLKTFTDKTLIEEA